MSDFHATAQTLADDIRLLAKGSLALHSIQVAFEATMIHIADIGGKLAPAKSRVFATLSTHRSWLASYVWAPIQQQVLLVHNLRNLGSALSFTASRTTSLSVARLTQAINAVIRIGQLSYSRFVKGILAMACTHAKGLYRCELSQVD